MKSVKSRFVLSNIAMIIIPVLITLVVSIVILGHAIGQSGLKSHGNANYFHRMGMAVGELYGEYTLALKQNPDQFLDSKFLKSAAEKSAVYAIDLAVIHNGKLTYTSMDTNKQSLETALKKIASQRTLNEDPLMVDGKTYGLIQNVVKFKDGSSGNVFLITDLSPFSRVARDFIWKIAVVALLALVITNGFLTLHLSKTILKPLEQLRNGARKIMDGNLDFKVPVGQQDEIGELCSEFDLMRIKLKASLETQVRYEDNRKELISSISHDLRTPLSAIRGYVEGIADGIADTPEKQHFYLETVKSRIGDMERLIADLMFYSRLDMDQMTYNIESIGLPEFLEAVVADYQQIAAGRVVLKSAVDQLNQPLETSLTADRLQFRRVLINLLDNSLKAMDGKSGIVELAWGLSEPNRIWVEVRDQGQGIAPEHIPHVFDRFYKADAARTSDASGSGLGLAIVKKLLEAMNGTIKLESTLGQGTTVRIELPGGEPCETNLDD